MFERDIEISSYLGEVQKDYGWPLYIDATTGKNRPDRIIKSLEQVSGALVLYQAVQSLDENVLRNVKRTTIKLEAYEQLQVQMAGRGLRSNSDLILALPGETLHTHLNAMRKLLDSGVDQVTNFQLMMLKGSELETVESRKTFSFQTRFRVLPKNFGIYADEKVMDVEEIAVATDTLALEDYLQARRYALASVSCWHDNTLVDLVRFAHSFGVKKSAWLDAMLKGMEDDSGVVRKFMDDFLDETRNELFLSAEECLEFYRVEENFQRLLRSEIGDNLLHKYQAIASFHIWPDLCNLALDTTKKLLLECGARSTVDGFDEFWLSFGRFELLQHAHGQTVAEIMGTQRTTLGYDIVKWIADGMPKNVQSYKLSEPQEVEFRLSGDGRRGLGDALQVWTSELKGLTKMIKRICVVWQVRECHKLTAETSGPMDAQLAMAAPAATADAGKMA
jgi:hypothetical protein